MKPEPRIDDLPTPRHAAVKGSTITGMENLRVRFGPRVGNHVDGSRIVLICQVPAIDED